MSARLKADAEVSSLLAAGRYVVAKSGYEGLKVPLVMAKAGLSSRAFYRHFASKDELLLAMHDAEIDALVERLVRATDAEPGRAVGAWMRALVRVVYDRRTSNPQHFAVTQWGALATRFPDDVAGQLERVLAPLVAAIEAGVEGGSMHSENPRGDAVGILSLCQGVLFCGVLPGRLPHADAIAMCDRFATAVLGCAVDD